MMTLSLIAGIGKNNELGYKNMLLWDLPRDMKYFRTTTSGHPVIMGRKTFESIGRPLPNRRNIVITRDTEYKKNGIEIVHSLEEALNLFSPSLDKGRGSGGGVEVFVMGGAEIYKQAIEYADRLYITHVDGSFEADTFFPEIAKNIWTEKNREHYASDEENKYAMDFVIYEKLQKDQ